MAPEVADFQEGQRVLAAQILDLEEIQSARAAGDLDRQPSSARISSPRPSPISRGLHREPTQHYSSPSTSAGERRKPPASVSKNCLPPSPLPQQTASARCPRGSYKKTDLHQPRSMSKEDWTSKSLKRKRTLAHIGRIDETSDGVDAPEPCDQCAEYVIPDCKVYTDMARERHHSGREEHACSRCRSCNKSCSFQVTACSPFTSNSSSMITVIA